VPAKRTKSKAGPKGLALSIGINKPSRTYYGDEFEPLRVAENDARKMSELARKRGFVCRRLLGRRATWARVMKELGDAAASLESGDIFLLSYSGHGSAIQPDWIENNLDPLPPSVEPEKPVQTWLLWDKELLDKELRKVWTWFGQGVRILVVLDSCHSQTAVLPPLQPGLRKVKKVKERVLRVRAFMGQPQLAVLDRKKEKDYYGKVLEKALPEAEARNSTKARLLSLAACQDNELAVEGNSLGVFTKALLDALKNRNSPAVNYTSLINQLQQTFLGFHDLQQQPGMLLYPDENSFQAERPFTIGPGG
jgi:hypothetical protein